MNTNMLTSLTFAILIILAPFTILTEADASLATSAAMTESGGRCGFTIAVERGVAF